MQKVQFFPPFFRVYQLENLFTITQSLTTFLTKLPQMEHLTVLGGIYRPFSCSYFPEELRRMT